MSILPELDSESFECCLPGFQSSEPSDRGGGGIPDTDGDVLGLLPPAIAPPMFPSADSARVGTACCCPCVVTRPRSGKRPFGAESSSRKFSRVFGDVAAVSLSCDIVEIEYRKWRRCALQVTHVPTRKTNNGGTANRARVCVQVLSVSWQ